MLLIFCDQVTPRVDYIFKIFFHHLFQVEYTVTSNAESFASSSDPKLNYSTFSSPEVVNIHPMGLLYENDIKTVDPKYKLHNEQHVLFSHEEKSDLSYDPFSAAFYMISRYEEYLEFEMDVHDRFPLESNLSFQKGFHQIAVVHHWANELIKLIEKKFPDLSIKRNNYKFKPTFDIDNAYAFKNKNIIRTIGALVKSALQNNSDFKQRIRVLLGKEQDPYDNYDYLEEVNKNHNIDPLYFVLTEDVGPYDKNIEPRSNAFKELLLRFRKTGQVGIHPSYGSNRSKKILSYELKLLSKLNKSKIEFSRQHYLKLSFPQTYELLIENNISHDYSMGFAESTGFRAGICSPYPFYNLKDESETKLMIYPFSFMESTFMYYNKLNISEIKEQLKSIIQEVKSVDGEFIAIWHNESLGDTGKWKDWREIFESMYNEAGA